MPSAKTLWESFQKSREARNARPARPFSGRNDFRLAYFRLIEKAIREGFKNYYVVNYYGDPGHGKSALLRRLETELMGDDSALPEDAVREECLAAKKRVRARCGEKKPVVLRADFDDPGLSSVRDILFAFRTQLVQQTDMAFPFFDLAMELLYQKQGRYLKNVEREQKSLTDDPVLGFLWDAVSDATPAGTIIGAARALAGVSEKVQTLLRDRKETFKATYGEIRGLDVPELLRRLPLYFAMDVNATDLPLICVFLDTYEMAYSRAEGAGYQAGLDEGWLAGPFGLIRNLGNAVFAVAGREKLDMGGEEWKPVCLGAEDREHLPQKRLDPLSENETRSFLTGCGLTETLAAELYDLTDGDPVYLELCLDQYESMRAAGREPRGKADFGGSVERLVERHTRYLPAHLREPLGVLAALERWDDTRYAVLQRELPLPLPIPESEGYIRLTGLSYVRREKGAWALHHTMAGVLATMLSSGARTLLAQTLARLGEKARKAFDLPNAAEWYGYVVRLLNAYPDCLAPEDVCAVWECYAELCEDTARPAERIAAWQRLAELRNGDPRAACELGRAYFDAGQYENALPPLRKSVDGFAKKAGNGAPQTLLAAGLYHAACKKLEREDSDPLTAGIGWDYKWTGRETAEELETLREWWPLRFNYSEYGYEENHEFLRKLAAAFKGTFRHTPESLAAEAQMVQQYAESKIDTSLTLKRMSEEGFSHIARFIDEDQERKWDHIPSLRDPEEVCQTCAELVEHHKQVLAPNDPQIADALGRLAFAQEHQCHYELAIASRQEALGLLQKAYGGNDKAAVLEEKWLIEDYRKAGRFADAIRQQQTRMDRLLGETGEPVSTERQEEWRRETKTMATLCQQMLRTAESEDARRECLTRLRKLWEEYAPALKHPNENDILPWGRAAIWCLAHPELDVADETEPFVREVLQGCRTCNGEIVAESILRGLETVEGWRAGL